MHGEHGGHMAGGHVDMEADFRRRTYLTALLTIPVLLLSPMVQHLLGYSFTFLGAKYLLWVLASVIVLWGGWPFFRGAAAALPSGTLDMNVLVSVAVGAGYLFSTAATFWIPAPEFYAEICTLVVFLLFGHWMEMRSVRAATSAMQQLATLIPPTAHRIIDDRIETVPTAQLHVGDILLVRPGEQVPIDGVVIEGESEVNEALITGESQPVPVAPGAKVIGGTLNGEGAFRLRVTATGHETAVAQIIDLITRAQASKTRTQRLADRAAQYLTLCALIVGVAAFLYWQFFAGSGIVFSLLRMVSVLIVACPHALGLAIPTVVLISSTLGARAGILIRNNQAVETATRLDTMLFDKTGTLTCGTFGVTDLIMTGDWSQDDLLRLAAAVEANSEHAIARGIARAAEERHLEIPSAEDFHALPGYGARAIIGGMPVLVGNRALMERSVIDMSDVDAQAAMLAALGKTFVYVAADGKPVGIIALADLIRPESYPAVRALKEMGIRVMMLTGDNARVAAAVARELDLDHYFAEVTPGRKAQTVQVLQAEGHRVGMVGDGINDAPALVQADVGIAIGAGTDVAIESADVVLVRNDPRDVVSLLQISRLTTRKMKENLAWATGYNVIAIPVAAGILAPYGILLSPQWAALLMAASSIIVVFNALLLRRAPITPDRALVLPPVPRSCDPRYTGSH